LELNEKPPERIPIRLLVGFPRPIQLKRLLRDLANLGVSRIDLVGTELGEKSYRDTKLLEDGGAKYALIEGAIQARDTRIPLLSRYFNLKSWLEEKSWREKDILITADNVSPQGAFSSIPSIDKDDKAKQSFVIAIGSERGWSDNERALFENAGFKRLAFGKRALRTETACIASVILAMEKIGELD
jgi:RsmE family RNA methyltransferase